MHHWKILDLEITYFFIIVIPHTQVKKLYHLKLQTLKQVEEITFQLNLHTIHHWKNLDLDNPYFDYHHDPTPSGETISSQISNP